MNRILALAFYNIRLLLSEPGWFVLIWALFGLQITIYGSLMSRLVLGKVQDYFFFYAVGLLVITVFDSGTSVAHNFVEHGHEGELPS